VQLPADHAPHPTAQTEWWHVHAELADQTGAPLYLFAAFVVQRTQLDRVLFVPASLAGRSVHAAYLKLQTEDRVLVADRVNFPDRFAARFVGEGLDVRHGRWRLAWEEEVLVLSVGLGRQHLELELRPTRPATLPGADGRVSLHHDAAHLWAQHERMDARGSWRDGRAQRWVRGSGFFKHQWGRIYDDHFDGFEWFSVDVEGGLLSIAWLHDQGARGVPGSLAWWSMPDGSTVPIATESLQVEQLQTWRSPRSRSPWPVAWKIVGPDIDLEIRTLRQNQELWVFPTSIYAGPAMARGTARGAEVDAIAFVEGAGARQAPLRSLLTSAPPQAGP
jgi:predicted secreted hydrolase